MVNKTEQIIQIFVKFNNSLQGINETNYNPWKVSLVETVKLYLGSKSGFIAIIENTYFTDTIRRHELKDKYVYNERKKEKFSAIINQIIAHIRLNPFTDDEIGPKVMPAPPIVKHNVFFGLTNNQIYGKIILIVISPLLVVIGGAYLLGKDMGEAKLERENNKLILEKSDLIREIEKQEEELAHQAGTIAGYEMEMLTNKIAIDSLTKLIQKPKKYVQRKSN